MSRRRMSPLCFVLHPAYSAQLQIDFARCSRRSMLVFGKVADAVVAVVVLVVVVDVVVVVVVVVVVLVVGFRSPR